MPYHEQQVTSIRKWSEKTFSFTTTRPENFQFENGEFVTIGIKRDKRLIARAYSIVSTNKENHLEFLSIHVPDGPLTSQLVNIQQGDSVWINDKSTGSLTVKYVQPGRTLYMLATGTGLAPFVCLIKSPEIYQHFEKLVLVHTVRTERELAYKKEIEAMANDRLFYVPTVTREPFDTNERCTDLFTSGKLFEKINLPPADPEFDRIMLCGNPAMLKQMVKFLDENGWTKTNHKGIGNYTTEKAFVVHHS